MNFLLWFVYYPCIAVLSGLLFWHTRLSERKRFERKNRSELLAQSFNADGVVADLAFEFSSEGEYQQVASLIADALKAGKKLELIFFSPSVEKTVLKLAQENEYQIRYYRYPLITFSPMQSLSRWMTSRKLILVRYDFFPEILAWASKKNHELILVWATFKKERLRNQKVSWHKRLFFQKASKTIYASLPDQKLGLQTGFSGPVYDFRIEQIRRRVAIRVEKFQTSFSNYQELKGIWEKHPAPKRVIMGNAWPSDLFLLKDLPADCFVLVVPHQLHPEMLAAFVKGLAQLGRKTQVISDEKEIEEGATIILNKKGVLCELYADFDFSYVGGGFETSVHSILEPLVAGSYAIACGPIHYRSTEYDVAQEFGRMTEVKTAEDFSRWLKLDRPRGSEGQLKDVFQQYPEFRKDVISC